MEHTTNRTWRRTLGQKLRHMSALQAARYIDRINAHGQRHGATIEHPVIRELTGGFASQHINQHVIRKLAAKAGMIRKENA